MVRVEPRYNECCGHHIGKQLMVYRHGHYQPTPVSYCPECGVNLRPQVHHPPQTYDEEERPYEHLSELQASEITDGYGNWFPARCPDCGAPYELIRPGKARCSRECDQQHGDDDGEAD